MVSSTRPNRFTCEAQAMKFCELLKSIAACPQDYVSLGGHMTTNTVEGFHGLVLMYWDKINKILDTHTMSARQTWQCVTR